MGYQDPPYDSGPSYGSGPGPSYGSPYGPGYGSGPGPSYGPGYGPPYGPGYGSPYGPPPRENGNATTALVCAVLMSLCCNQIAGIVAVIFAALAMGKQDQEEQQRFVKYAWITMALGLGIIVLAVLAYLVFMAFAFSSV